MDKKAQGLRNINYRPLILTIFLVLTKDFDFEFRFDLTNEHFTVIHIAKMWLLNSTVVIYNVATDIDQA